MPRPGLPFRPLAGPARVISPLLDLGAYEVLWSRPGASFRTLAGFAAGIETAALDVGGRTLAVIGTPLSGVYPRENRELQVEVEEQAARLAPEHGEDAADVARAALFCAFLDRRTPLPLLHDLRFHLKLYRAAKETGWVHAPTFGPGLLRGRGVETCGLDEPLACHVDQETHSAILAEQTSLWHREELRRTGRARRQRAGRWPARTPGVGIQGAAAQPAEVPSAGDPREPGPGEAEDRRPLALVPAPAGAQLGLDFD